jgi:hypothetical protein
MLAHGRDVFLRQHSCLIRGAHAQATTTSKKESTNQDVRECVMSRSGLSSLPRQNPCAQCGKPIAMPEWVETNEGRACYLWHCWACDYRFEAIAFFDESTDHQPIAA